jgi:hypothetical protein
MFGFGHSPLETEDRAHFSNSLETGPRRHLRISADISAGIGARWNLYVSIPPLVRRGANPLCSTSFLHLEERQDISANKRATFPVKHRRPSTARMLGTNVNGLQLRAAPGVLQEPDSLFGGESAHAQCQPTVGCHLDGSRISSLQCSGHKYRIGDFHNTFGDTHVGHSKSFAISSGRRFRTWPSWLSITGQSADEQTVNRPLSLG